MTCVRLACAGVIDAHLKKKHHAQYSDVPMRGLLVHEMVEGAFYAVLCLGKQFWLERIDLRNFEETWRNANEQTVPWPSSPRRDSR